jgi:hypothetical protein
MRRGIRRAVVLLSTPVVAVAAWVWLTLPPTARQFSLSGTRPWYGAFHVHSTASDGTGSFDEIASSAAEAGLDWVVTTDHGDLTRALAAPAYRHGVLHIDAAEISTDDGHLIALGVGGPAPYPLAGEAEAVVEDVHRLGGWTVAAHPDSPRSELAWQGPEAGADAIEWINADSARRDRPVLALGATALRSLVRPAEAMASLLEASQPALARWDRWLRIRPTAGLAALDAHGRLVGWAERDSGRGPTGGLQWPSYAGLFRALSVAIPADRRLTGVAADDARMVLSALRSGASYSVVRGQATGGELRFSAAVGADVVPMGGTRPAVSEGALVRGAVTGAPGATVVLYANGTEVVRGTEAVEHRAASAPAAYRAAVFLPGWTAPWMVSNAIRLGLPEAVRPGDAIAEPAPVLRSLEPATWRVEHDPGSQASLTVRGPEMEFAFTLGASDSPYAALAAEAADGQAQALRFALRADAPMRVAVQVRLAGAPEGRWRQSVYVDTAPTVIEVPFATLRPVAGRGRVPVEQVGHYLLVVDTVNRRRGTSGRLWVGGAVVLGAGATSTAGRRSGPDRQQ